MVAMNLNLNMLLGSGIKPLERTMRGWAQKLPGREEMDQSTSGRITLEQEPGPFCQTWRKERVI